MALPDPVDCNKKYCDVLFNPTNCMKTLTPDGHPLPFNEETFSVNSLPDNKF